jgi:hypothetical protein
MKSLKSGQHCQKLTKAEQEVLTLLTMEFLDISQVAIRRQTSVQAIYKIRTSLIRKGVMNRLNMMVENSDTSKGLNNDYEGKIQEGLFRLHSQQFKIKLIYASPTYEKKTGTKTSIDGNTIFINKDSISLYGKRFFYSESTDKAQLESLNYYDKIMGIIENDFKVIIRKPRSQNIQQVTQHWERYNSKLGKWCEVENIKKVKIYTTDNHKLWFTYDKSEGLTNHEYLEPKTAKDDADNVEPYIKDFEPNMADIMNDIRDNSPMTLSQQSAGIREVLLALKQLTEVTGKGQNITNENASGLNAVIQLLKAQLELQKPQVEARIEPDDKPEYIG